LKIYDLSVFLKNTKVNDNEEKELLMTLLKSYEDEFKINQQTDYEIPLVNTSSSIRFIPPFLHFPEQ